VSGTATRAAGPVEARGDAADRLAAAIERDGHAIEPAFLDAGVVERLRERALALDADGRLQPAAIGRAGARHADAGVRADRTLWLADAPDDRNEAILHAALEAVRVAVNRRLMLGLFSFEGHYALYPPGGGYARHLDRFRDDDARVLSCVLYLNQRWCGDDGGALRLYRAGGEPLDVLPRAGTLVAFLSAAFEHEVLPARRTRLSVAGWFRRRGG
jgi:SM-20-related protein